MEYFDIRDVLLPEERELLEANESDLDEWNIARKNFLEPICEQTDGKIPKEIGEMLVKENNDPDYTILIHRTSKASQEKLFKNGLTNDGGTNLRYTTDRYTDNMQLLINVRDACKYKSEYGEGSRCVIMKIPNTALNYTKGETKPILYQTDEPVDQKGGVVMQTNDEYKTVLLPEYILGTVEFEEDRMTEFVKNPNYTEVHDYQNDGLVCPEETIDSYMQQKSIPYNDENKKIANEIIIKENNQYLKEQRSESDIKEYAKKGMLLSKFNEMVKKVKNFFTKDKTKEENSQDVDK